MHICTYEKLAQIFVAVHVYPCASATPSSAQPPIPASGPPQVHQNLSGVEGSRTLCR